MPNAEPVAVERIKVHGRALEGNLEGDAADRDVFVFLPPSYAKDLWKDGLIQQNVLAKWAANAPLVIVDQHIGDLRKYRGIANSFEVYSGTHTSAVADRFQNHVLPFMSRTLCFKSRCSRLTRPE